MVLINKTQLLMYSVAAILQTPVMGYILLSKQLGYNKEIEGLHCP